jgi:hypothetical protein
VELRPHLRNARGERLVARARDAAGARRIRHPAVAHGAGGGSFPGLEALAAIRGAEAPAAQKFALGIRLDRASIPP